MTLAEIRVLHDEMAASFSRESLTLAGNAPLSDHLSALVGIEVRENFARWRQYSKQPIVKRMMGRSRSLRSCDDAPRELVWRYAVMAPVVINEDEMRQNLVIYPLGFRLTDPVAGAHYPLADGPGARRSAVRTIMASLLDIASRAGFTAQGNSKMYRPAGLALLIGVYIVVCCLSFRLGYPHYRDYYIFYDGARPRVRPCRGHWYLPQPHRCLSTQASVSAILLDFTLTR